jgi:hypothetical protein
MEMAKLQYADEIASAKETSAAEMQRIREESTKVVETARSQAKVERERTTEDVVTTSELPPTKY